MFKNILIFIIATLLFFLTLEIETVIYIKVTGEKLPPLPTNFIEDNLLPYIFDSELGWKLRPSFSNDQIQINSLGFRSSKEFNFGDNVNQRNILLLGDSMIFGQGISQNETFSEILNNKSIGYNFVNTGVPGYNTLQEYLILKKY